MNIYVSNLSFNVTDDDLREFLASYGEVASAKVIKDKLTGRSCGFGFVEMCDDAAAKTAMSEFDGGMAEGRAIKITEAKPPEKGSNNDRRSFSGNRSFGNKRY